MRVPKYLSTARLFRALLSGTLASIAFVMLGLLVTGATESTTLAFVEAASTVTGTNASTIDVSKIEPGVMLLRALGQWVAGAASNRYPSARSAASRSWWPRCRWRK